MANPRPETIYIIGEIKHLSSFGVGPADIAIALNRTPASLAKLLERNGEQQLVNKFVIEARQK